MKMTFNDTLINLSKDKDSKLCIGLDIDSDRMPNTMDKSLLGLQRYIEDIIDSTSNICLAYKLNMAFYERYGSKGYALMEKIVEYIDNRNLTIADGKRGDIGNTTKKYALSIFESIGFDSITVSPYMGSDSIIPFIQDESKGVFVLCLTSNTSAKDIQFKKTEDKTIYQNIAELCSELNNNNNIGLVVGATNPEFMKNIRDLNNLPWLIPGIGAQGGDLEKSVQISNQNSIGLINVSRAIIFAGDCNLNDVRNAATSFNNQINVMVGNEK
tara:strand:- start:11204 stop:12013 length:810 start_codon:yes stop_codon:yes gene_type:complete